MSLHLIFTAILAIGGETVICQRVIDGDTIELKDGRKVRLAEIDAPERNQPWGRQASDALRQLLEKKQIELNGGKLDRYGRLIAHVTFDDEDVGERLVRSGLAWQYRIYSKSDQLTEYEQEARDAMRGLWGPPIPPWEWRKGKRTMEKVSDDFSFHPWNF